MTGGKIENNVASGKGKGGGCVLTRAVRIAKGEYCFHHTGRVHIYNSASAGGGVYTYSNDVTLSAGKIEVHCLEHGRRRV